MPKVRATLLMNAQAFVTERFGATAHRRVLAELKAPAAALFSISLPTGSRIPLEHLVAYMVTAKRLFAPDETGFHREIGRFAGTVEREESAFSHMVADRETLLKTLKMLWRAYYSEGKVEIVSSDAAQVTWRAVNFRGDPVLCERITGATETQAGAARSEHGACVFRGDAACQWTAWW